MERSRADATTVGAAPGCRQAAHSAHSFAGNAGGRVSDEDADGVGGGGGGGGVDDWFFLLKKKKKGEK